MKSIALIKNETKLIKPFSLDLKYSRTRNKTGRGGAAQRHHPNESILLYFYPFKKKEFTRT